MVSTRVITALNAVTATTTSNKYYVGDAKRIAIQLRRADHTSGSTSFAIKVSLDDVSTTTPTMTTLNLWIDNATNTNVQGLTRVGAKVLSADGDAFLFLSPEAKINFIEITATETTDGTHSAFILLEI